MRARIENLIHGLNQSLLTLVIALVVGAGCATTPPNPLAGWHSCFSQDPEKLDKAIRDDYRDYIQKLPAEKRNGMGPVQLFEDGTGQHAVAFEVFEPHKNASWHHALFYDKGNKRIKTIKYGYRRYMS